MKNLKIDKLNEEEMNHVKGGGLWSPVTPSVTSYSFSCTGWSSQVTVQNVKTMTVSQLQATYPTCCGCACAYANSGGSSTANNEAANKAS